MYTRVYISTILFLFSKINFGKGENIPTCVYDACDRITDPEYLTTSCCPGTDLFVKIINECKGGSPTISTCSQATCILARYDVLTDGLVDVKKVEQAIVELDAWDSDLIPLNALTRKYCLVMGNYTCFPSKDPYCENWKFINCAFFAFRMGCPITYSDCACDDIAEDVDICQPYQRRYLRELNKGCNECLAPPLSPPPPPPPPRQKKVTPKYVEYIE